MGLFSKGAVLLKKYISLYERGTSFLLGTILALIGLLMVLGGSIYLQVKEGGSISRVNFPQNTLAGIVFVLFGVWVGFIGPRLQLRLTRWLRRIVRRVM